MVSKELMKNKDRLERIEIIREIRRKLGSLRLISNEEKAMALKALNDYEFNLETDITRSINNAHELEEQGISHDIQIVEIKKDDNRPSYPEFATAGYYESLDANIIRIKDLLLNIPSQNIADNEKIVFLEALKDYCRSLKDLKVTRENNRKNYPEIYENEEVKVSSELVASRPYTPTMSQKDMFNDIYATYKKNQEKSR